MTNILLTGGSGFLGGIIKECLGPARTCTLGRHSDSDIRCDLSTQTPQLSKFDIVIHAAGKAHSVPRTVAAKQEFFDVNVEGSLNLIKGLENSGIPKSFVFISSVAVYGKETGVLIDESANLASVEPYGRSKIIAEEMIAKWCFEHGVVCTIFRLPLVAGTNPPGNLGAMVDGIKKGYYFNIDSGKAKKSIVLASDVASIIPTAAKIGGIYNLTDGYHPTFRELSSVIARQLNKRKPGNIPILLARSMALVGDLLGSKAPINSEKLSKITSDLTFDDSKAQKLLDWQPSLVLEEFRTGISF